MRILRAVTAAASLVAVLATSQVSHAPTAQATTPASLKACTRITATTSNDRLSNGLYTLAVYTSSMEVVQYVRMYGGEGDRYFATTTWNRSDPRQVTRASATYLALHCNGDLALRRADHSLIWHSNTANRGIVTATLSPWGNLLLKNAAGAVLWQSGTTAGALGPGAILPSEGMLATYGQLPNSTTRSTLTMQADGNLVLRRNSTVAWQTRTSVPGSVAGFSPTGHLFVRSPSGTLLWVSPGARTSYSVLDLDVIDQWYPTHRAVWGMA
ncbi:hypothetical protein ACOCJ5_09485 [Knoellia sp. CPCC 206450]|uniref:hypothetical protein n=1 Tax=Knoellia tibetensis TaxID=3404798 RepID=UPI003B437EBE